MNTDLRACLHEAAYTSKTGMWSVYVQIRGRKRPEWCLGFHLVVPKWCPGSYFVLPRFSSRISQVPISWCPESHLVVPWIPFRGAQVPIWLTANCRRIQRCYVVAHTWSGRCTTHAHRACKEITRREHLGAAEDTLRRVPKRGWGAVQRVEGKWKWLSGLGPYQGNSYRLSYPH